MRKFVNNWLHELIDVLPEGSTSLPLPAGAETALALADGDSVVLTITSSMQPIEQTAWEFILLERDGGVTTVTRGALGSTDQEWPAGAPIYADLPAEQMAEWHAAIADLQERVADLEAGGGGGGGGGIQIVSDEPDPEDAEPGEAFLVGGSVLAVRNYSDFSRFQKVEQGSTLTDALVYANFPGQHGITQQWTPATAPTIEVPGWVGNEEFNMRWLLITAAPETLTLANFIDPPYANLPVLDISDFAYEVSLPAAACWITLRRCYSGPWVLLVEPLQTPTV